MKYTITCLFIFCFQLIKAQTGVPEFTYCQLVGNSNLLGTKVSVYIDYGQSKQFLEDTRIRDEESGKVKKFNSMVDAMNYMGEMGWEFVQAYSTLSTSSNVYTYVLKRKLTEDEKKNYVPIIKRDIKD